ncbi:probable serine/threonine-protein kinase irlF [Apis florea]|uniref:probable serine/threonine-protein kinase irlF n=1 Tax=Apis florea TaxID=7463 RepID=UPI0012FEAD8F|nr:probable serine/threonine-protein kinase irlF [Apis florea]
MLRTKIEEIQNDKRLQGNKLQRLSNIILQQIRNSLYNYTQRQTITNSIQQKQLSQFQKEIIKQKFSSKNVYSAMNIESLNVRRKTTANSVQQKQLISSPQLQVQKQITKQKSSSKNVHSVVNVESLKTRQKTITNPTHEKQILPSSQLQFQKEISKEKSSSKNKHNIMNAKPLKSSSIYEKISVNQQCSSSQSDSEYKFSENDVFLKNLINNKVQHQIKGNIAKMLVIFVNGEQRLITFEIPHEDCTVQDLLKQANIILSEKSSVSLISNPTLDINYLVKIGSDTITSLDIDKNDSFQNNMNNSSNDSNRSPDKNIDSIQQNKTNNEHNSSTKSEKLEHDASMHKHKRKKRIISKSRPSHKEPEDRRIC